MGRWAEFGDAAKTAFYLVPELELTQIVYEGFESTYREFCPECTLRTADIPIASLGSTSATVAVDDLLAHPDTTVAAFSTAEAAIGLARRNGVRGAQQRCGGRQRADG